MWGVDLELHYQGGACNEIIRVKVVGWEGVGFIIVGGGGRGRQKAVFE